MIAAHRSDSGSDQPEPSERRHDLRHDLTGMDVRLLAGKVQYVLHLKDLSCTGLCALTDAPLAPGDRVYLLFEQMEPCEVEICWTRRALFGAAFTKQLSLEVIRTLCRRRKRGSRRG